MHRRTMFDKGQDLFCPSSPVEDTPPHPLTPGDFLFQIRPGNNNEEILSEKNEKPSFRMKNDLEFYW